VQIGLNKAADLPDVPLLIDLAKNPEDGAVLKLISEPVVLGRPIFTTPDVPPERVQALRDAFDATINDPAFLDDARGLNLPINAPPGTKLQQVVADIAGAPKAITARLSNIVSASEGR
jgi:hypothetical protein